MSPKERAWYLSCATWEKWWQNLLQCITTGSELKKLADYLKSLDGETRVIMGHTGRYYEPVAQFLHDEGLYVSAVNPKLIKDYGNPSTTATGTPGKR